MKIGFFGTKSWEREYVEVRKGKMPGAELWFTEEILNDEHLPAETDFEAISVFVDSAVTKEVIKKFPKLKFIAARSTGYDNIDLSACRARGVAVSNVPSYGENTVAEMAFGLILSLSRKIYESFDRIRETGNWSVEGLQGFDLKGKTLGVVGTGRIGRHIIRMARGFEMSVIGYDPFPNEAAAKELGFSYAPLAELLRKSDIVTLHVPYSAETHHLLNDKTFSLIKRGALMINTSRGGVIDTEALVRALRSGQVGGAGLDVLEEEGVIKDELDFLASGHPEGHNLKTVLANHVLIDMPNVIVTPHNAFNTKEALMRILDTTIENVRGFLDGKILNGVNQMEK